MFPFWLDLSMTSLLQITALAVAAVAGLLNVLACPRSDS